MSIIQELLEARSPSRDELIHEFQDRVEGMKLAQLKSLAKTLTEMAMPRWRSMELDADPIAEINDMDARELIRLIDDLTGELFHEDEFWDDIVHPVLGTDEVHPPG